MIPATPIFDALKRESRCCASPNLCGARCMDDELSLLLAGAVRQLEAECSGPCAYGTCRMSDPYGCGGCCGCLGGCQVQHEERLQEVIPGGTS